MRKMADRASVVHALGLMCNAHVQAGRISIVGVYAGFTNGFNIGGRPTLCTASCTCACSFCMCTFPL